MKSVCVFCGSSDNVHPNYLSAARKMGMTLAGNGLRLVFGGGKTGLMGALADGALGSGGEVIGVIIPSMYTPALAHMGVTRMDVTSTSHERKARMHELADCYIALPGGFGTFDELFEALTWGQIGEHRKAIGMLNVRGYFNPLLAMLDKATREGFIYPEHRKSLLCESDPLVLLEAMEKHHHPDEAVRRWMRQDA
jgi:hypothetical protein